MKKLLPLLLIGLCVSLNSYAQTETITVFETVKIINNNRTEALFYYENNWKVLRRNALKKNYIHSFEIIETKGDDKADFDIVLITRYKDQAQFEKSEENFQKLIKARGELKLKNALKPNDFRQSVFVKTGRSQNFK